MIRLSRKLVMLAAAVGLLAVGCSSGGPLSRLVRPPSPYERYAAGLSDAGLEESALGRDWIQAGERALTQPMTAEMPFHETAYFPADRPSATAYRLDLRRGRRFVVDVTVEASTPVALFVDLFEARDGESARRVAALDAAAGSLTHDVDRDGVYLLRVQPELLRSGRFVVTARTLSRVTFPVEGSSSRDVASAFHAARDGGRRTHEGVDIFAPRGTAVVAAVDGVAQSDTNQLGGNVVWLVGSIAGPRFYYAHLDRWEVEGTARVRAGDVLGYVGNTGNARTTGPHLHFGIYDDGAIDPTPFLQPDDRAPAAPSVDETALGELARVTAARVTMRSGTAPTPAPVPRRLERATVMRIVGAAGRSYRVRLPDMSEGYVDGSAVARMATPLRQERAGSDTALRESPLAEAPVIAILDSDTPIDVLGRFGAFQFVRDASQRVGWIEMSRRR